MSSKYWIPHLGVTVPFSNCIYGPTGWYARRSKRAFIFLSSVTFSLQKPIIILAYPLFGMMPIVPSASRKPASQFNDRRQSFEKCSSVLAGGVWGKQKRVSWGVGRFPLYLFFRSQNPYFY